MLGLRCATTFNKLSRRTRRRTTTCPEPSSPARLQRFFPRSIPRILICIASTLSSCCIGSLKLPDRRGGPFHNSYRNRPDQVSIRLLLALPQIPAKPDADPFAVLCGDIEQQS